jgi:hypothetical protein
MIVISALVTHFLVHPLNHDGIVKEDIAFREYLEQNGYDTSRMGLFDSDEMTSIEEKEKSHEDMSSIHASAQI